MKKETQTSEGLIPHLKRGRLDCPVKLDIPRDAGPKALSQHLPPLRRLGRLVYCLPGGGEFLEGQQ